MTERINIPSLGRTADDIQDVGDYQTIIRGAEAKGRFYCLKCGAKLTDVARTVPNDGLHHVRACPVCHDPLVFNGAWLVAKIIEAQQRELLGLGPTVEPGNGQGVIREEILPNGRKRIIACPLPAVMRAVVPHGGKP